MLGIRIRTERLWLRGIDVSCWVIFNHFSSCVVDFHFPRLSRSWDSFIPGSLHKNGATAGLWVQLQAAFAPLFLRCFGAWPLCGLLLSTRGVRASVGNARVGKGSVQCLHVVEAARAHH